MARKRTVVVALVGAALAIALLVVADQSGEARPGGGRSYSAPSRSSSYRSSSSGSSRSSGGTSYRSSGTGYTSPSTPRTTVVVVGGTHSHSSTTYVGSPRRSYVGMIVGLVVLALIIGFVIYFATRKKERAKIEVDHAAQTRGIMELRQRDPGFDPVTFGERTKAAMAKLNEAWLSGSMISARRLISDGVFVRFQTQLNLLKAVGQKNVMVDWKVVSADILAAEADELWDTVHVKIVGAARDTEVPYAMPREEWEKKARSAALEEYHECWSFLRRRGQKSVQGVPALEGRCPGCGADMPVADVVKCEYCSCLVNSGEHDWVLAEITQPEEWSLDVAEEELEGLQVIRARDGAVSRQELEDRASVIFWKWLEARQTKKLANLQRFAMMTLDEPHAAAMFITPAVIKEAAVGSSEIVDVLPGGEGGSDRVVVEVRWSASLDGKKTEGFVHCFHLERAVGAQSKRGMSSLDCPNCGGAMPQSDAAFCDYCGEALSGGKHEWALAQVQYIGQ